MQRKAARRFSRRQGRLKAAAPHGRVVAAGRSAAQLRLNANYNSGKRQKTFCHHLYGLSTACTPPIDAEPPPIPLAAVADLFRHESAPKISDGR
jgi:hypothetical protein